MTFYKNRGKFEGLSLMVGRVFSRLGLSPNQWTFVTILPTLAALYFLVQKEFILSAIFFIIASFIDLVDGSVARVMGKVTKLGAYLDTMMDRYVEFLIVLGLLFIGLPDFFMPITFWIFIYYFGAIMTSYSKAAAKEKDLVDHEIKGGIAERAERLILLFVGVLLAHFSLTYLTYMLVILAFLSNITALQRAFIAKKASEKK